MLKHASAWTTAVAVGALFFAGPADASPPGIPGKIAFGIESGSSAIAVVNPDGSGLKTIASSDAADPAWSPDGRKVAFARRPPGDFQFEIYVMNADGSSKVRLTQSGLNDFQPAWSPDGTQIVFVSNRDGTYRLYVMNADGSGQTQLTGDALIGATHPAWSPGGSLIAFTGTAALAATGQIHTIHPDGTALVPLTSESTSSVGPDWSPDGTRIAFARDGVVIVMNANGSGQVPIATGRLAYPAPVWSPAGDQIAFVRDGSLAVVNPDGSGLATLRDEIAFCCPSWQALQLTLTASTPTVSHGAAITLNAHLFPAGSTNSVVSIFMTALGGTKTLVAAQAVDGAGNVSVSVAPKKKTTYVAEWTGDATHAAASSFAVVVTVRPLVKTNLARFYGSAGGDKLFHQGSDVGFVGSVVPKHAGKCLYFKLQKRRASGAWGAFVGSPCFRMAANGTVRVRLGGLPLGRFRVRSEFRGDADHLANVAAWRTFRVT